MFDFGGVPSILFEAQRSQTASQPLRGGCLCRLQLWREAIFFGENRERWEVCVNWVVATQIFYMFTPNLGEDFQFE